MTPPLLAVILALDSAPLFFDFDFSLYPNGASFCFGFYVLNDWLTNKLFERDVRGLLFADIAGFDCETYFPVGSMFMLTSGLGFLASVERSFCIVNIIYLLFIICQFN